MLDIVISVVRVCWEVLFWLSSRENKWQIDLFTDFFRFFHGACTNLPIVDDVNISYAAKPPNSTRGVIFNLNYIAYRGCNVYGSASLLALRVWRLSQAE